MLVVPHRFVKGWDGRPVKSKTPSHWFITGEQAVQVCQNMELKSALAKLHPTDAYLVGYEYRDTPNGAGPRLTKSAMTRWKGREAESPALTVALVDVDYENHGVPPEDWHTKLIEQLPEHLADSCGWYRTPHGLRLVWRLDDDPVTIFHADSFLRQLHHEIPFETDIGTSDWTRLQRLPRNPNLPVLPFDYSGLDKTLTWRPNELEYISHHSIGKTAGTTRPMEPGKITRAALSRLKKHDERLADRIYNNRLSAAVGERHATLLGAALSIVNAYETNDAVVPYDLLAKSADDMGKSADELWSICEWAAATYDGRVQEAHEEQQTLWQRTAASMGCSEAQAYRRLIIDAGKAQFIWDEERMAYSPPYAHRHQILPAVDRHCDRLLRGHYENFDDIIRDHSTVARNVVFSYDPAYEGFDAQTETMYHRICRQDPTLQPKYSPEIAEWLERLFAGEHYENVMDWLASVPDLSKPICGLYIQGENSIGKSLFVSGLARLWNPSATYVKYSDLTDNWNEALTKSPVIYGDEKATDTDGHSDTSVFRQIIGNSSIPIKERYMPTATLLGYPRLVISANNADALRIREDLDPADIDAIRLRIGYVNTMFNKGASDILPQMAAARGFASAREMADPWIKDGIIAQHVLWLHENRKVESGDRFLVEGWESDFTRNLSTSIGAAGMVVDAIVEALTSVQDFASVRYFGGHVYVSNPLLARDWKNIMSDGGDRLPGNRNRLKALRALSDNRSKVLSIGVGSNRSQKMYWQIDAERVAYVAQEQGSAKAETIMALCARPNENVATNELDPETVLEFGKESA